MVVYGKTHYSKPPIPIPSSKIEATSNYGEVTVTYMTPEEIKEYFATKYPDLEKRRKMNQKR